MKKKVLLLAVIGLAMTSLPVLAQSEGLEVIVEECELQPLSPTFLDGVQENTGWHSNWFVTVQGGVSAFLGNPIGHEDFFGRTLPVFNAAVGKWVTPQFGARISFQGFKLNDWQIEKRSFQNLHADFLYNISSHFRNDREALPQWDVIPYVGLGIIRNSFTHQKPFALSAGVSVRYRLATRLHLTGELGATNTFQDFDGAGASNKFGDWLTHASLGLTFTIGKVGWKRVVDAKPYMSQNDILINYVGQLKETNNRLARQHGKDEDALNEMKKILEIEGLLNKYKLINDDNGSQITKSFPKNDYSGLNSLRARIRNRSWNGDKENYKPLVNEDFNDTGDQGIKELIENEAKQGKVAVGAPIFFFFKINTNKLTEESQVVNIKEIAKVAKKHNLYCKIIGAADSQTGNPQQNEMLSAKRADYIASMLRQLGVADDHISSQMVGGIDKYEPVQANRHTRVILFVDQKSEH